MKLEYIGQFAAVTVPFVEDGFERELRFERGVEVECPAELAASLLEQEANYRSAHAGGGRSKAAADPPIEAGGDA